MLLKWTQPLFLENADTLVKDTQTLALLWSSTIEWLCLKLMSKENNDAGWRPCPRWTYEINFWKGTGLPVEVTCLLRKMPCRTRTSPDPWNVNWKFTSSAQNKSEVLEISHPLYTMQHFFLNSHLNYLQNWAKLTRLSYGRIQNRLNCFETIALSPKDPF